ncbi:MAG: acetate--CoA ligase family protein, partial [Geminicoccaceae bacterium]|nr:acetate--CoA ligase family protein [Geminicoccaceae bacterium]
ADGHAFEGRLKEVAGDLAVLGPNCYGLINLMEGVALWPDEHGARRVERGVALITQSGNIGITLTMQARALPIACVVSVGNQALLRVHDVIEAMADDPRVGAIGLYLEAIPDLAAFARAALICAEKRIPLVAIKAGSSAVGARTALSHTSSLSGQDALVDAYLRRYGVVRVRSLADLLETLKLLFVLGPLPGRSIASLSCSGGDAAMVADLAAPLDLELPPIPPSAHQRLADILGPRVEIANPLDYHTYIWGDGARMHRCFGAVAAAGFDATLLILDYPRGETNDIRPWELAADAFIGAVRDVGARGVIVSSLPETLPSAAAERIAAAGLAPMQGLPGCLRALAAAGWLAGAWRQIGERPPPPLSAPLEVGHPGEPVLLAEGEAKRLLAGHGIPVARGRTVEIAKAALEAERIGLPVVLKTAARIAHKTEVGGVILGLTTPTAVQEAADALATLGERVRVEVMLPKPLVELIVGIDVDPQFGPHLVIGAGGQLVELWQDTRVLLLPADPDEIRSALGDLRVAPVLLGYRGRPPADVEAVVEVICRLGAFALQERQRLLEVDINPLMVYPAPEGVIAADALIRLTEQLERREATED